MALLDAQLRTRPYSNDGTELPLRGRWQAGEGLEFEDDPTTGRTKIKQHGLRVAHITLTASEAVDSGTVTIDFTLAPSYTLILDQSITTLAIIPPDVDASWATTFRIKIRQSGSTRLISGYTGCVFYGDSDPVLSTTTGYVDMLAADIDGDDPEVRFMFTAGAPT